MTLHFRIEEFACRDGTPYPPAWAATRLLPLCEVLEILRAEMGNAPITIASGYRTEGYNRTVGGARHSQHVQGRAADIRVQGVTPLRVHDTLLRLAGDDEITLGGLGRYFSFTHVDVRPSDRLARWTGTRRTT